MNKLLSLLIVSGILLSGCVSTTNFPTTQPTFEQLVEKTKQDIYIHAKLATVGYLFTVKEDKKVDTAKSLNIASKEVIKALEQDIELTSVRDVVFSVLAKSGDADNKLLMEFVKSLIEVIEYDLNVKLDVQIPSDRLVLAKELGLASATAVRDATEAFVE